jgi:hypothetical protein
MPLPDELARGLAVVPFVNEVGPFPGFVSRVGPSWGLAMTGGRVAGVAAAADAAGERFVLDFQLATGSWRREPLSSCRETGRDRGLGPGRWQAGRRRRHRRDPGPDGRRGRHGHHGHDRRTGRQPEVRASRPRPGKGPGPGIGLEGLPAAAAEAASWWEPHITEVVYGTRPDAPAGTRPRPEYDPERTPLTGRERAKAAELTAAGRPVTASTVKHRRQRWEAHGLAGLVDQRAARRMRPAGRADDQVVDALRQAVAEAEKASSRTTGFIIWRAKEILAGAGYDGAVPSDRTLYRLFGSASPTITA